MQTAELVRQPIAGHDAPAAQTPSTRRDATAVADCFLLYLPFGMRLLD
jgi:hypothetical protein